LAANEFVAGLLSQQPQEVRAVTVGEGLTLAGSGSGSVGSATNGGAGHTTTTLVAVNPDRVSLLRSNAKAKEAQDVVFDAYDPPELAGALPESSRELAA